MPDSSVFVSVGSSCFGVSDVSKSFGLIELIIVLKSSNLSAGILNPFFVGPV